MNFKHMLAQLRTFRARLILYIAVPTIAFTFFNSVSPFSAQGTVVKENVLIGAVLVGLSLFLLLYLFIGEVFRVRGALGLCVLLATTITEVFLLASISLISAGSILAAAGLNLVMYWYVYKRFKV